MTRMEQAVLAGILRENALYLTACAWRIGESTFTDAAGRRIWGAISAEIEGGRVADLVSVAGLLPDLAVEIAELDTAIASTVNFGAWAEKLKIAEAKERLRGACERALARLTPAYKDVAGLVSEFRGELEAVTLTAGGKRIPTLTEAAEQVREEIEHGAAKRIPFFPDNTEASRAVWVRPGEMFVLGARTGGGKTAFCATAAVEQLTAGHSVAYFCTESSTAEILARIAAAMTDIPHYAVNGPEERAAFDGALRELTEGRFAPLLRIVGNDGGALTVSTIEQHLRNRAAAVVYVDFVQNLRPAIRRRTHLEEVDDSIQRIHDLLGELGAAGIVVSQFNRSAQSGAARDELPDVTWLKDTSTMEQLAATVAFLWRQKDGSTILFARKRRNGPGFKHVLGFWRAKYVSSVMPYSGQEGGNNGNTDPRAH